MRGTPQCRHPLCTPRHVLPLLSAPMLHTPLLQAQIMSKLLRSSWMPGAYVPAWSGKHNSSRCMYAAWVGAALYQKSGQYADPPVNKTFPASF